MTYHFRIPADSNYLQEVGRAFYNFTYLEWIVIWTIVKLSSDGFGSVPKGKPAGEIARAFTRAIRDTSPPLPRSLHKDLAKFDEKFRSCIRERNKLLHAHPLTGPDGMQRLGAGSGHIWTVEEVNEAAKLFEDTALTGSRIFHNALANERP